MASVTSFQPQPSQPAPSAAAIGQALVARRMASNPVNAQPGFPGMNPGQNTMRGPLPMVGRRLLQADPSQMQTPTSMGMGTPGFGGGM